jgi:hypothetical protein
VKVLVIPEDQEIDRYILKPVIEAMFADLEVPARVDVLPEPRLRGTSDALDEGVVRDIVSDNPMIDLFLLVIDRDCNRENNVQRAAARVNEHADRMVGCLAEQELEVWMLALYKDRLDAPFSEVRAECDPKERWAEPLLKELGTDGPGRGRRRAMRELSGKWRSLRDTCTELRDLQDQVRAWVARRGEA